MKNNIVTRRNVTSEDVNNVREIVFSTGFFSKEEVDIAVELVEERLTKGEESGYFFLFMEIDGKTIGYSCFGPIPATKSSYDLYWIAVHAEHRGGGIGKYLLEESEKEIRNLGGTKVFIETASREQYLPTRKFYLQCNCEEEAVLKDFYAPGDSKVIYSKYLI